MKTKRQIYITESDDNRLRTILSSQNPQDMNRRQMLDALRTELDGAIVIAPGDIPENVVTMNSKVILTDLDSGETMVCTLVFPGNSDPERNSISILAPVGAALIGRRIKDNIDVNAPAGRKLFRIDGILSWTSINKSAYEANRMADEPHHSISL
jgi:regulator of nucleoside diphosphate kinase